MVMTNSKSGRGAQRSPKSNLPDAFEHCDDTDHISIPCRQSPDYEESIYTKPILVAPHPIDQGRTNLARDVLWQLSRIEFERGGPPDIQQFAKYLYNYLAAMEPIQRANLITNSALWNIFLRGLPTPISTTLRHKLEAFPGVMTNSGKRLYVYRIGENAYKKWEHQKETERRKNLSNTHLYTKRGRDHRWTGNSTVRLDTSFSRDSENRVKSYSNLIVTPKRSRSLTCSKNTQTSSHPSDLLHPSLPKSFTTKQERQAAFSSSLRDQIAAMRESRKREDEEERERDRLESIKKRSVRVSARSPSPDFRIKGKAPAQPSTSRVTIEDANTSSPSINSDFLNDLTDEPYWLSLNMTPPEYFPSPSPSIHPSMPDLELVLPAPLSNPEFQTIKLSLNPLDVERGYILLSIPFNSIYHRLPHYTIFSTKDSLGHRHV